MKMRIFRFVAFLVTLLSVSVAVSCEQTEPAPQPQEDMLSVTPSRAMLFAAQDNEADTLYVNTNVESWSYDAPEWVIAEKDSNKLIVNVADNGGELRQGNIIFAAGTAPTVQIEVCQRAVRSIRQVVYIEVNDCNPLNILEYNLADGSPFFDAVILFAANINYDSENNRVYLHNNPNVQALLDDTDTYLQPLRERGIKVYLGILGNHDAAGVAQLSAWGARQWAQEVADVCCRYKLDGVNLDDEYSKAPDLQNEWFTARSASAGARLAYELKVALSEKCSWPTEVSIYEYGSLYRLPAVTVDGVKHTQSEFIDMVLADYGCQVEPYGDLSYAQCSGASIQLAYGGKLSETTAKSILSDGYGWCMWFAFDPSGTGGVNNNLEHSLKQFDVAARVFYNTQMLPPKMVYNKCGEGVYDPLPYAIGLGQ